MCERPIRSRIAGQCLIHNTKIIRGNNLQSVLSFFTCCKLVLFLLLSQVTKPHSKTVSIVITVIVVMLLSIVAGAMFVKKYVCGGRSVSLSTCIYRLSAGNYFSNNLSGLWMCRQVLGTQVLRTAAACWGELCWGCDGWTVGDQPRSQWQDRVPWWLRWGVADLLFQWYKQTWTVEPKFLFNKMKI